MSPLFLTRVAVLRVSSLTLISGLVLILLSFGAACEKNKVTKEKATKDPQSVLQGGLGLNLIKTKAFRIEYQHKHRWGETSEILEYVNPAKWHSRWEHGTVSSGTSIYEVINIDGIRYDKSASHYSSSPSETKDWTNNGKGPFDNPGGSLVVFFFSTGYEKAIEKANIKVLEEEILDGEKCAVFEYIALDPTDRNLRETAKQTAWVSLSDGLFRKIFIETKDKESGETSESKTITFSYDDRNIKIEPPV